MVEDGNGGSASVDVELRVCPGCNNGVCNWLDLTKNTTYPKYHTTGCKCNTGYTGLSLLQYLKLFFNDYGIVIVYPQCFIQ